MGHAGNYSQIGASKLSFMPSDARPSDKFKTSLYPTYRPDIDGLRGIAVLAVVAFHAAPGRLMGGFIGVDIFFVISGFLISSILLKSLQNDVFSLANFYSRRIRRIFPALLAILGASLIAGWFVLLAEDYKQLGKHAVAGAAFFSNFALWSETGYFDNAAQSKILLHLWSLGIEEQFYIFWPVLLWLGWKSKFSLPLLIASLAVCSFVANVFMVAAHPASAFYLPFTRAWELFAGALLACSGWRTAKQGTTPDREPIANHLLSIAGASLLVAGLLLIDKTRAFPGWWAVLPVSGAALIVSAGPRAWLNSKVLSRGVLVWVGLISYPLYLWHWPILSFLRVIEGAEIAQWKRFVAVCVAFLLAWATYRCIEIPVRHAAKTKFVPLCLLVLMSTVGLVGCYGYFSNGFEGRSGMPKAVNAGEIGHYPFFAYISKNFFDCTPMDIRKDADDWNGFVRCFQSKDSAVKNLAILGDSHAEHLFVGLAEQLPQRNVVFYGKGGLPFADNKAFDRIFEYVLSDKNIDVVLITANWKDELQGYSETRFRTELIETLASLTAAGKRVYLTDDVPTFSFNPDRCKYAERLGLENKCSETDARSSFDYRAALRLAASESSASSVIGTYDYFCQQGVCYMARNGVLNFRDTSHLNVLGSEALAKVIVEQMDQ